MPHDSAQISPETPPKRRKASLLARLLMRLRSRLLLLLVTGTLMFVLFLWQSDDPAELSQAPDEQAEPPGILMRAAEVEFYGASGQLKQRARADEIRLYAAFGGAKEGSEGGRGGDEAGEGEEEREGDVATNKKPEKITFNGSVLFQSNLDSPRPLTLRTTSLQILPKERQAETAALTQLTTAKAEISGVGLHYDMQTGQLKLGSSPTERVRSRFSLQETSPQAEGANPQAEDPSPEGSSPQEKVTPSDHE